MYYSGVLMFVLYKLGLTHIMQLAKPSIYSGSNDQYMRTHSLSYQGWDSQRQRQE